MTGKKIDEADIQTNTKSKQIWWLAAFVIIFCSAMLYANHADITEQYYDTKEYWNLANDILYNGYDPIYILRFPQTIRGYFFPMLVGYFKFFFNGIRGWRILASLSLAACFSLSLPYAIRVRGINSLRELLRTLAAYAVFLWVWGNLMQYPLSDFPAFFFLISAIALLRAADLLRSIAAKASMGFFAGVLLYAAYNTRPTFLYSILIIVPAYAFMNRKNGKSLVTVLITLLLGMTILALPQCYINNRHEGSFSPKVFYNLMDSEVYRGIYTARYETCTGNSPDYRSPELVFNDPVGRVILEREKLSVDDFRLPRIFDLFLKYPADMTGIYFRHLLSLLTPVYRDVYITDIYDIDIPLIIVSILLWLTAGYGLLVQIRRKGLHLDTFFVLAVCIPGLLQIFDEPELRFFLPLYVLCYYYVFAVIDYRELASDFRKNWLPVLLISLVLFVFWINCTSSILSGNYTRPLLISDNSVYLADENQ